MGVSSEVEQRTQRLSELADKIAFGRDGEALLKGTTTDVYRRILPNR